MLLMASRLSNGQLIALLAVLSRLLALLLLNLLSSLPSFDSSHQLLSADSASSTLRWDAVHFASIVLNGYQYEQQLAFQPGWPGLMRLAGEGIRWVSGGEIGVQQVVLAGVVVANIAFVGAAVMLHK